MKANKVLCDVTHTPFIPSSNKAPSYLNCLFPQWYPAFLQDPKNPPSSRAFTFAVSFSQDATKGSPKMSLAAVAFSNQPSHSHFL